MDQSKPRKQLHTIEIFSANCPLCNEVTDVIEIGRCQGCKQIIYDVNNLTIAILVAIVRLHLQRALMTKLNLNSQKKACYIASNPPWWFRNPKTPGKELEENLKTEKIHFVF